MIFFGLMAIPITTDDIVYTFDVYSDPNVESRFFGQFKNFLHN